MAMKVINAVLQLTNIDQDEHFPGVREATYRNTDNGIRLVVNVRYLDNDYKLPPTIEVSVSEPLESTRPKEG